LILFQLFCSTPAFFLQIAMTLPKVQQPESGKQSNTEARVTPWDRFRSFIWDTDTKLKSPAERKLLFKLDFALLTFGCIGFFNKYLDVPAIKSTDEL
jgi:hypothetical protein